MPMKFRAHDTFFIRKGWLSKGMRCVHDKPDLFVDKEENPMDVLGIGTNMVKALRYWLQAVGLTIEPNKGKRTQSFTPLGQLIFDHDTYIEELGTLHLLQLGTIQFYKQLIKQLTAEDIDKIRDWIFVSITARNCKWNNKTKQCYSLPPDSAWKSSGCTGTMHQEPPISY